MRALVTPLKQAGARVILLTPPYVDGTGPLAREWQDRCLPRMGDDVIALGREEGLPVFDMFTAMREITTEARKTDTTYTLFTSDNLHPSAEGQKRMGRALADFLAGKPSPARPPFMLTFKRPESTAGRVSRPLDIAATDVAWPTTSTPLILDRPEQIVTPPSAVWKGPADLSARGMTAWDAHHFYVRVEVTDPVVVVGPKQPAWGYDSVEFFFDTRPLENRDVGAVSGYFQLLVGATEADGPVVAGAGKGSDFDPSTVRAHCRRTATGYMVVAAVPWRMLGIAPEAGATVGFDFTVINRAGVEPSRVNDFYGLWRADGNDYLDAGCLGVLTLAPPLLDQGTEKE
jgi:hypothetical protein